MTLTSPGPTLGVVGGGQLGRMLGEAAAPLGVELVVSDPTPEAPASPVARDQIVGGFDDRETIRALAERSDYLTFEIELADPDLLASVADETGVPVHPAPETLRLIQDKLVQKRQLQEAGIPVPEFRPVDSVPDLRDAFEDLGYPAMLKARQGGYDGRGNVLVEEPADVEAAFEDIAGPAMLEEFVDYERELAVMGCLGADETATFPVTETIHEAEILRTMVSPARANEPVRAGAQRVAYEVLEVMAGRGVFGIELFDTGEDILLNEIAPRPHNSGHWTIEGAHTSQFEQHVRAVTGRPLGSTDRRCPTATVNILGDVPDRQDAVLSGEDAVLSGEDAVLSGEDAVLSGEDAVFETDQAHLHWYGKREVYDRRKMGHVTLTGEDTDPTELLESTRRLREELTFDT